MHACRYDADGNKTLDESEWLGLVSDLIDGTAKEWSLSAKAALAKQETRGIVMSMDDLVSDDDEGGPAPPRLAASTAAARASLSSSQASGSKRAPMPQKATSKAPTGGAARAASSASSQSDTHQLRDENRELKETNKALTARVEHLEKQLKALTGL